MEVQPDGKWKWIRILTGSRTPAPSRHWATGLRRAHRGVLGRTAREAQREVGEAMVGCGWLAFSLSLAIPQFGSRVPSSQTVNNVFFLIEPAYRRGLDQTNNPLTWLLSSRLPLLRVKQAIFFRMA